ncbi:DNA-directed RNA polymerase II subunit rpb4, partial [Striga asiatica]
MSGKGGKTSLKSPVGNGESSGKSRKGKEKTVQFDSEDSLEASSPKSNGKADPLAAKGGKGGKTAKGSKKTSGKATSIEQKLEQELPPSSQCLMDCEAADILQSIQDQMVILSQDPDIKLPGSFDMGLTYAKRSGNPAKPETVKKIFEPLKKHGVSESEICMIVNICPESVDEVFALIPGLKPKMSKLKDPIRIALDELANLKEALANLKNSRGWHSKDVLQHYSDRLWHSGTQEAMWLEAVRWALGKGVNEGWKNLSCRLYNKSIVDKLNKKVGFHTDNAVLAADVGV